MKPLRIFSLYAYAGIKDQEETEQIMLGLSHEGYVSVNRNMILSQFNTMGIPEPHRFQIHKIIQKSKRIGYRFDDEDLIGDIFFKDDNLLVVQPRESIIIVSLIGYEDEKKSLEDCCGAIEKIIQKTFDGRRVRGMQFNWKPVINESVIFEGSLEGRRQLRKLKAYSELKFEKPEYNDKEIIASDFLTDKKFRHFLQKLSQLNKIRENDALNELKEDELQNFVLLGLASEEYFVSCKEYQRDLCVIQSKDNLKIEPLQSTRCPECNRKFSEENISKIYTISDMGKKLINGSTWMSIWVIEQLQKLGINKESIEWQLSSGGDELDIAINDFGDRAFLELKDREFGVGDAYPFDIRINRYGGSEGAVITTDKISNDAKKFFSEQPMKRSTRLTLIEGVDSTSSGLEKLVHKMSMKPIKLILHSFTELFGIDIMTGVELWANKKIEKRRQLTLTQLGNLEEAIGRFEIRLKNIAETMAVKLSIDLDKEGENQLIKKYVDKIKALPKFSSEKADEFTKQFSEELEIKAQNS